MSAGEFGVAGAASEDGLEAVGRSMLLWKSETHLILTVDPGRVDHVMFIHTELYALYW